MPKPLLIFLLLITGFRAQAQTFVSYSLAQGLPQSQVYATLQDSRGYMWFGTQGGGLCRFDGLVFQTYTTDHGLPSNYVNAIFEDADQRLWVGTNAGVCISKGNIFEPIAFAANVKLQVLSFCQTQSGTIWAGTEQGIFRFDAEAKVLKKESLALLPEKTAVWALCTSGNEIWVGSDAGAFRTGPQQISLTTKNGLRSNAIRGFAKNNKNQLWIASAGGGLTLFDEATSKIISRHPDPAWTTCVQPDRHGKIWVGTSNNGVSVFNTTDSTWTQTTERQGFPHQFVRAITLDNSGNIWVGTSGGGAVKFLEGQAFTHYGIAHGLAGNRVYALQQNREGKLLMSVSLDGLQLLDSAGIHPFVRDSGFLSGVKSSGLALDHLGRTWVGTSGRGLLVFDSAGMHQIPDLPSELILQIASGAPGEMWAATGSGIACIQYSLPDSFSVKNYGRREGLKGLLIRTLHVDQQGRLWFADQLGHVGLIQNGQLEHLYGPADGLPSAPVRCIVTDQQNHLWVGTKGAGIFEATIDPDSLRFLPLRSSKKLTSENIYLLLFDPQGQLWAGSESGVDKISFEPNSANIADIQHFGKNEGFLGIETCQDAGLCDAAGNLWFGTMNGLMKYTPSSQKATDLAPILHFEAITLFYKSLENTKFAPWLNPKGGLLEGLELPWDENHLSFEFRAVDLAHPDAIQYRWKLDGSPNAQWSPLSTQTSVNFAGLQPGDYTFLVQASADGQIFSDPKSASFSIKKPYWQLLGFQVLVGLGLLAFVFAIAMARIRSIRKSEQAKREQLELQNHLLQLEQKALQLQMNPHFLFNALNSIQALVSAGDPDQARIQIGHFAQLMRGILKNSRQSAISLKEEADTLEQYLRMEQYCQQNKFEYTLELPENIDPEELEIPPMLLQPFVENAVVHGVSHLSYPGKISISFRLEGALLCCSIRDNGVGREKAAKLRQERKPGHQSVAVQVTGERLEALKAEDKYDALEFIDLKTGAGEIIGTEVLIKIPARINF